MHREAHEWVARHATGTYSLVLEFGSLDVNGGVRDLFNTRRYVGIDVQAGRGVDQVADAATFRLPLRRADVVVCCEVLEHAPDVRGIITSAYRNLRPDGTLIVTCATHPRRPHSAIDGGPLRVGEWYSNVDPYELEAILHDAGFDGRVAVDHGRGDLYAVAGKQGRRR